MDHAWAPGQVVRFRTRFDNVVEGEVFGFDRATGLLALRA